MSLYLYGKDKLSSCFRANVRKACAGIFEFVTALAELNPSRKAYSNGLLCKVSRT